jgi:putative MATE family efflux protein
MSAATLDLVPAAPAPSPVTLNPRTRLLLHGAILPTLLSLAWPNVLVMLAQASVGLIETWWVSHLGPGALAGIALVFPGYMMMTMLSAGAMGGGIASAIARALGGRRQDDADALVLHALVINGLLGLAFAVLFIAFGRPVYVAMGGEGPSLEAAMQYANVVFAGGLLLWIGNALAGVLRGGGNMALPSAAVIAGVALLIPLSPLLIYGYGSVPAYGVAGAGYAVLAGSALTALVLAWAVLSGRSIARFRWMPLRWRLFSNILGVGAVASINTLQTTLTVALTTALVATASGTEGVAGYGVGSRFEYLLVPLVFGLGAPLVALVGTNVGAGSAPEPCASRCSAAPSPSVSPRRSASPPPSGPKPGSDCSATTRPCSASAPTTSATSGPSTASSASAWRSTSPPKAPGGCSGRCSPACCAC